MDPYKIFAINLGSTSTKLAYYENDKCIFKKDCNHSHEDLSNAKTVMDQYDFRERDIKNFMLENGINATEMDAIVSRGGLSSPIEGGVYLIDDMMIDENKSGKYGTHPCCLGCGIAKDLVEGTKALPLTVDTPSTCEFGPLAFYSGMPEIKRTPQGQPLNGRAIVRKYAESVNKNFEELNVLLVNLGGGITTTAFYKGKMIDSMDGVTGDGTFSNNRCNAVPVGKLVDMCYSGKYTYDEMRKKINGNAGLMGYLGIMDVKTIEERIDGGDEKCREVLEAMCYQISKDIGAFATVLKGDVDAIIITGNMSHSKFVTEHIKERVSFIAPIVHIPGQLEMESLCMNAYKALSKQIPIKRFEEGKINV